ncbi:protein phosphatase 2C [Gregarina niphandrodes]|uniref:Protein phosphatase 2C n=1 Tax=Gregarina niphandrodes TaxID=110365 RepID=A0A023B0X4_GRENI|nr:protein phosphatase 2C [Gregarina niphandrodes]EZG45536.1 protein phosphatase 2C [Gregarina niphandrodes]|eukprot:XP_011132473.1 protein phosphatase 2C [Gregarina niphandrodes]
METPEHNPGCPGEAERIRSVGSSISIVNVPFFTKPISRIVEAGLSVSRSFGDLAARQYGVTAIPDLIQIEIQPQQPASGNTGNRYPILLVLASDGLWDTATYLDLLEHIHNTPQSQQKLLAKTRKLAEIAWRRRIAAEGRADDTTIIAALLR